MTMRNTFAAGRLRAALLVILGGVATAQIQDEITALELINSDTNNMVVDLVNGMVIDLSALGLTKPSFSVNTVTSNVFDDINSIRF